MIPNTSIHRIIVIGNKSREPERIQYLESVFADQGLTHYVHYVQPTYKDTLPEDLCQLYFSEPSKLLGRSLKSSEISIFLNFLLLFETILRDYSDGYFAIFESDVLFDLPIRDYLTYMEQVIRCSAPDCLSIGSGLDMIHDNVNMEDMNFQLFPSDYVRCMDSFLFSYNGIRKFVDYIYAFQKEHGSIDQPIDNFFETFLKGHKDFVQLWVWPSLTQQGSQNGTYATTIQEDAT